MVSQLKAGETVLTGLLEDRSAVFGVIAQIEALGLELLELRQIRTRESSRESRDDRHRMAREATRTSPTPKSEAPHFRRVSDA
jgi:hypothetical protein